MSRSLITVLVAFLVWLAITAFAMFCLQGWVALVAFILGTACVSVAALGHLDQKRPVRDEDSPFPPSVTAEAAVPVSMPTPRQTSPTQTFAAQKLVIETDNAERISLRQGQGSLVEMSASGDDPEQVEADLKGGLLRVTAYSGCIALDFAVPAGVPVEIRASGETTVESNDLDNELDLTLSEGAAASLGAAKHVRADLDNASATAATVNGDLDVRLENGSTLTIYGGAVGLLRGRVEGDSHLEVRAEVKVLKLTLAEEGHLAVETAEDATLAMEGSSVGSITQATGRLKATLADSVLIVGAGEIDFLDVTAEGESCFTFDGSARTAAIDASGDAEVKVGCCLGGYRIRERDDSYVEIRESSPLDKI